MKSFRSIVPTVVLSLPLAAGVFAASTDQVADQDLAKDKAALPALGLCLWLRGTACAPGPVARWADQSGLGNDAVQSDPNWQPTAVTGKANGLPVVHFPDGKLDGLSLPDFMAGATGGEVIAVLRKSPSTNFVRLWTLGGANGSRYPEGNGELYDDFATKAWTGTGPAPGGLTDFHIYDVGGDDAQWFMRFDGAVHFQRTTNQVAFNGAPKIGEYFAGDFAEIIVYQRVLGKAERESVYRYLAKKYALILAW
jgi:hypothetical protein